MGNRLSIDDAVLASFCARHHITRLDLFGSVLRGDATSVSDVDLIATFEPGNEPGLIALSAMEIELSELLGGRTVDLRTAADLSRYFREEVLRSAEMQYAR